MQYHNAILYLISTALAVHINIIQKMGSLWSREVPRPQTIPPQAAHAGPSFFRDPCPDESRNRQYTLVIVGDHNTGKESLMNTFAAVSFTDRYTPTVGVDFTTHTIQLDEIKIKLQIWATGTTHNFHSLWRAYYRNSVYAIITYSVIDKESFDNVPYWIEHVKRYAHSDTRLALVGTKCDCTDDKVVDYTRARDFANERQIPFFEVSSKDGTNVELAFVTLVAEARQLEIDLELSSASSHEK